jgi:glutathione synthase/RimK-type ligase-like ATP-grasp enzyme
MTRIALATSAAYKQLTADDHALIEPLTARGFSPEAAVWSDPQFPWSSMDAVILRSCWDYHLRLHEFLAWLAQVEQIGVGVWNRPSLVRWNADKIYLQDLEAKGVPIIPTIWPDNAVPLADLLREQGWNEAVVKPRVSATAHQTFLTDLCDTAEAQRTLRELVRGPGALVQKLMPEIQIQG